MEKRGNTGYAEAWLRRMGYQPDTRMQGMVGAGSAGSRRTTAGTTTASGALSLIHISEPTRQAEISYAVFCLKKKKKN